jgi:hypothetical protein
VFFFFFVGGWLFFAQRPSVWCGGGAGVVGPRDGCSVSFVCSISAMRVRIG